VKLFSGELEHEIFWEALDVPADSQIQRFRGHAVKLSEVGIEHDFVSAD